MSRPERLDHFLSSFPKVAAPKSITLLPGKFSPFTWEELFPPPTWLGHLLFLLGGV